MKYLFTIFILLLYAGPLFSQNLTVKTVVKNINASGGLTIDKAGNIYVSDFGKSFADTSRTKIYKVEKDIWRVSTFAEGFKGASGVFMDDEGVLFQSNPKGGNISKVYPNGKIEYDFVKGMKTPVGIVKNSKGEMFACNCKGNNILKIDKEGNTSIFSSGEEFYACPNGITVTDNDDLMVVSFNGDKIIKVTPNGDTSILTEGLATLTGGPKPVGLGHITYSNGYLFATAIGRGYVYRISLDGKAEIIAGNGKFENVDGPALEASFSKPNGIVASHDGDRLYINVSDPSWVSNPAGLHPAHLVMISGICSLPNSNCN